MLTYFEASVEMHILLFQPFYKKHFFWFTYIVLLTNHFVFWYSNTNFSLLLIPLLLNIGGCTICVIGVIGRINIYDMRWFFVYLVLYPYGSMEIWTPILFPLYLWVIGKSGLLKLLQPGEMWPCRNEMHILNNWRPTLGG